MSGIHFFTEDIVFNLPHKNAVRKWLKSIIIYEQHSLFQLNYIFCSDTFILEINNKYLNHNYFTDVITFNNSCKLNFIEGDIFISIDRIKENSTIFQSSDNELFRVMVHGLLHLFGYNDHSNDEILIMRNKENFYLSIIDFL